MLCLCPVVKFLKNPVNPSGCIDLFLKFPSMQLTITWNFVACSCTLDIYMKKIVYLLTVVPFITLPFASAQTSLYLKGFGSLVNNPDTMNLGDSYGLWKVYDSSYSSGPSTTFLSNLNGSSSPQGGNYWIGQMQGAGGGASNIPAHLFAGISSNFFITDNATPPTFVHGQKYVVHFYMNPLEFVTSDGLGATPYSTGALEWQVNGSGIMSTDASTVYFADNTYSKNISFGQWTDMAVAFTYDSAFGTEFDLTLGSYLTGGSYTINPISVSGDPSVVAPVNRVQSMGLDFGPVVPEPSSALLSCLGLLALLRRKR